MGKYLYPWFPAELEAEFLRQYDRNSAKVVRTTLILGGLVYCAFYIWDRVIDVDHSLQTLLIRVVVAVVILSGLLIPHRILSAICKGSLAQRLYSRGSRMSRFFRSLRTGLSSACRA